MLTEDLTLSHLFYSLGFILGGFVIGIIVEKVILARLKRFAKRTSWEGDEIVINSIKGIAILWFGLAGIYLAFSNLPLKAVITTVMDKVLLVVVLLSATIVLSKIWPFFIGWEIWTVLRRPWANSLTHSTYRDHSRELNDPVTAIGWERST